MAVNKKKKLNWAHDWYRNPVVRLIVYLASSHGISIVDNGPRSDELTEMDTWEFIVLEEVERKKGQLRSPPL
jgi:hypothetical protein